MAQCKWDELTGVECKEEATTSITFGRDGDEIPLCKPHLNEWIKDHSGTTDAF